ncbi:MAG: sugar kinase [Lentisphaerae bacterium RIFOXYA12_FULL_48_11]|nr:MAG: sugar kinase [Lentisphaerae bacterium RIFOXYA12_FULL_48_11]
MKKKNVKLVVVGSLALDSVETPFEKKKDLLGGSVSYACAAASFFAKTGMVAIAGQDFPPAYIDLYKKFGIDQSGLSLVKGRTFRWSGVYEANMIDRRTISTELNVFASFSPELPAAYKGAPFVLLGNIAPVLQLHVLNQVRKPKFVVADTMDLWINTAKKPLMEVISRVNMLMLNDGEARQLTGEYSILKCAAQILAWGPEYVVIKKGEHGALLFSKKGLFIVPAYPVEEVCDPTGAGDSFAGGFMGALAGSSTVNERTVRQSLISGSVVASFTVEGFSLNKLTKVSKGDVRQRLAGLKRMTSAA